MSGGVERWERVERLYHAALDRAPEERSLFLNESCAGDATLRAEIESLLSYDAEASRFLTHSALEQVATRLPGPRAGTLVGRQIHGYEIRELLGAGGMGEVYRATDLRLGRDVALKILRRDGPADPGYVRRFEDEARSASVLNHPNVVTIYGVGEDHDVSYIAMECVIGRTIGEVIAAKQLNIGAAVDLAVQLAEALAAAHDKGIIHRDLKPDNVMVTSEGRLKVLDFGIAKRADMIEAAPAGAPALPPPGPVTEAGQILGTVGYMSPEQADGRRATAASDQFSFGAILYELVSGRRAFERPTRIATLDAIRSEHPEPLAVQSATARRPLRRVLERCLAKDPAFRYASTRDLALDLRVIRDRLEGRSLSRRQVLWLGASAAGAVATAGALGWRLSRQGPRVRALALLPFANATNDPALDYLSNGMTDTLILRIGVLPSIRVMPHSLVSNFARMKLEARAFAQSIEADSYLSGSVARRDGELTITASLVEVATGRQLWSNSFTSSDADIQAAQEAIASEIVSDGIRLQLTDDERDRLVRRTTDHPEAYELFLKALLLHERQTFEDLLRERELLIRAIELDPKFAKAYAALAGTYTTAAIDGYEPPMECWPKSQANVREALSRDPELPDGHAQTAAYEFFYNRNWSASAEGWRLALRSRGADMFPPLRVGKALQEFALGRTADAVRTMAEVRKTDRLSPVFIMKEASFLREDGQLDKAVAGYETVIRALPESPDPWWGLADVRCAQGRFDEALAICRRLLQGEHPDLDRVLAKASGVEGYRRVQRETARVNLLMYDTREQSGFYIAPIDRARAAALLGDARRALRHLDEAFDARDPGVVMLKVDRAWEALRDHPKFQAAVKRVGLP